MRSYLHFQITSQIHSFSEFHLTEQKLTTVVPGLSFFVDISILTSCYFVRQNLVLVVGAVIAFLFQ